MSNTKIRLPSKNEIPVLKQIWISGFGDDPCISIFFDHFFSPELCIAAYVNNSPVGAGYLIPLGDLVYGNQRSPCAYIYAVAVLENHRGLGFGRIIVNELINMGYNAGYPSIALCPANDTLFEYYSAHTKLQEWFYFHETTLLNTILTSSSQYQTRFSSTSSPSLSSCLSFSTYSSSYARLSEIAAEDYVELRSRFLTKTPHIEHNLRAIEYQQLMCSCYGGGLFRIELGGEEYCAVIELHENMQTVIKELLAPVEVHSSILAAISAYYPSLTITARTPLLNSEEKSGRQRFGMLTVLDEFSSQAKISHSPPAIMSAMYNNSSNSISPAPWFGLAFD